MDIVKEIWKDLSELGFQDSIQTLPEFFSWLRRVSLIYDPPLLQSSSDSSYKWKTIVLREFSKIMSGNFGAVFLVYREKKSSGDYVFLKTSPNYPRALLLEAILQSVAQSILSLNGFPKAVPKVLDILKHPDYGVVFSVKRTLGSILFADYLKLHIDWGNPSVSNDKLILKVIGQVATYLAILESNIGLNHRDLKSTNILIFSNDEEWSQTIQINSFKWTLKSNFRVALIDFGFACIGRPDGQTIVSVGEYLPTIDFCPKQGRDLFLLFSTLWNVPAFRVSLTRETRDLFKKWLQDTSQTNWADWLTTSTETNHVSMYLLTNGDNFKSETCAPLNVLQDIGALYKDLVDITKIGRSSTPLPIV